MLKTQKEVDVMDVMTNKAGKLRKKIQLAAKDLEKPNVPLQDKYVRTQKTRAQNQLNKIMEEIDLKLMNPRMPKTQRQALVAEHQRAQELLTTLEPQPKLGISKTITPPSTPQRVQEGHENVHPFQITKFYPDFIIGHASSGKRFLNISTHQSKEISNDINKNWKNIWLNTLLNK